MQYFTTSLHLLLPLFCTFLPIYLCYKLLMHKIQQHESGTCYLLHYECYKGADEAKLDAITSGKIMMRNKNLGEEERNFVSRAITSSCIGEETYCPQNVMEGRAQNPSLADAFLETDGIIFSTLDNLFAKTGISPSLVDILVTNISLFSPSPSVNARVINHYKMRENIKSFSLTSMGCSGSVVALDLVHHLFKTYHNSLAVVVTTDSLSTNYYPGKDKSMMISNILFRCGGCSMLLTNKQDLKHLGILKLNYAVREHLGSSNEAYGSCVEEEDKVGYKGFYLSKNLVNVAEEALTLNLQKLLPKMLPWWEKMPKLNKIRAAGLIQHFCVHPGGKKVIDKVGESLELSDYELEPSRMALHRFGNTSSAGIWYALGYMEAKKRLKKGEKILMIGFGAGFKCNVCVWEVMRDLNNANVWKDCVERYPPPTLTNPFMEKFNSKIYQEINNA